MNDKFILEGHKVVPCDDLLTWGEWLGTADRRVARTEISASLFVSTVFIGLDHSFGNGPPLLFETMVFRNGSGGEEDRCSTWEQAEQQHAKMVEQVTKEIK